jgi:hypothetical protein
MEKSIYDCWYAKLDGSEYVLIDSHSDKGKRFEAEGKYAIVENLLDARTYDVEISRLSPVAYDAFDEVHKFLESECQKEIDLSDSLGDGVKVGKLFHTQVADGVAWYVVTKVGKTTATVEWRGFCPSRETDQVLGYGGRFGKKVIGGIIERCDGIRKIFST